MSMKPAAPLIPEDRLIWSRVELRFADGPGHLYLWIASMPADCRDAALMLLAQRIAKGGGPAAIELYGIACRGWNELGYWIEDTEDGEGIWMR